MMVTAPKVGLITILLIITCVMSHGTSIPKNEEHIDRNIQQQVKPPINMSPGVQANVQASAEKLDTPLPPVISTPNNEVNPTPPASSQSPPEIGKVPPPAPIANLTPSPMSPLAASAGSVPPSSTVSNTNNKVSQPKPVQPFQPTTAPPTQVSPQSQAQPPQVSTPPQPHGRLTPSENPTDPNIVPSLPISSPAATPTPTPVPQPQPSSAQNTPQAPLKAPSPNAEAIDNLLERPIPQVIVQSRMREASDERSQLSHGHNSVNQVTDCDPLMVTLALLRAEADVEPSIAYIVVGSGVLNPVSGKEIITTKNKLNKCIDTESVPRLGRQLAHLWSGLTSFSVNGKPTDPLTYFSADAFTERLVAAVIKRRLSLKDAKKSGVFTVSTSFTTTYGLRPIPALSRPGDPLEHRTTSTERSIGGASLERNYTVTEQWKLTLSGITCLPQRLQVNIPNISEWEEAREAMRIHAESLRATSAEALERVNQNAVNLMNARLAAEGEGKVDVDDTRSQRIQHNVKPKDEL